MNWIVRIVLVLLLSSSVLFAEEVQKDSLQTAENSQKTVEPESVHDTPMSWRDYVAWPFIHILQPIFGIAVYPIAQPIHYAFDNGVIDKSVDLITFGKEKNILLYPTMNLKPGSSTMLGFSYRHRSMLLNRDYFVLEPQYFANGDIYVSLRYAKQNLFGLPLYAAFRYQQDWNRDAFFVIPGTKEQFTQPDSTVQFNWRLSTPLTKDGHWNVEGSATVMYNNVGLPDNMSDSVLLDSSYWVEARGLYQKKFLFPFELSLTFDNLDFAYAPSKGSRFNARVGYVHVQRYRGMNFDEFNLTGVHHRANFGDDGGNHDYMGTSIMFQHYFYLGRKSSSFIMSNAEARKNRKFYLDFNWDEALRVWHPDNVVNTLFERRVLAVQFRMESTWEMEKGESPFNAVQVVSGRYPLRGYGNVFGDYHVMGLSMEYRWPIDKYVDGVVFDEYAMHTTEFDEWSFDKYYNSWGFGVRVRKPDMFWFRVQFGFHGLHGVNLVLTIAPEFR